MPNQRIVFPAARQVELVSEGPPSAPEPGQVLVATRRSLISIGTELALLEGRPWKNPGGRTLPVYPHTAGYSNAGVIVAVGEGVSPWQPGDRIASGAPHTAYPLLRAADWAIPIPPEVSDEEATFCTLATTVLNGFRIGTPQLGEDAVVIGLGLLGQLLVQYLRLAGCRTIIAVDLAPARLAVAQRVGAATHYLNPAQEDVTAVVHRLTAGRGADVVYEATGRTETYNLAFALARFHGRVVGLGSPRQPATVDMQQMHIKALRVLGAIVSAHPPEDSRDNRWSRRANGQLVMDMLAAKQLHVRDLITHRFPASEAPAVYRQLLEQREAYVGVILEWE